MSTHFNAEKARKNSKRHYFLVQKMMQHVLHADERVGGKLPPGAISLDAKLLLQLIDSASCAGVSKMYASDYRWGFDGRTKADGSSLSQDDRNEIMLQVRSELVWLGFKCTPLVSGDFVISWRD